ncbi:MAG TPA: nucleotide exchange factor GrpE [Marinilabiliaceae bacterium]|nr:nucleotide exchange factor GrpE [Marinilabiliaceae bacterium]
MSNKKSDKKVKEEKIIQDPEVKKEEATNLEAKPEDVVEEEREETTEDEQPELTIEDLENKIDELNDKHLRLIAEYDNYRKRTLKEKIELSKVVSEKFFLNILPVVDDFDRALQHLNDAKDLEAIKEGILLIYNKFLNFMTQNGVTEIETHEKEFDLDFHEAVTKSPAPSEEMKGKIIDCVQKGYMLDGKVIRFPKVVVGE